MSQAMMIMGNLSEEARWFELWIEHGKSWGTTIIRETQRKETVDTDRSVKAWVTLGQLKKLYQDDQVAEGIKQEKMKHPDLYRPHPEVPHLELAIQFRCIVAEEKIEALLLLTMKLETDAHLLRQEIRTACSQSSTSLHMLPLIDQCCISVFAMMFAAIVYSAISAPETLGSTTITVDSLLKKHGAVSIFFSIHFV
jgi:hypothetical protein